MKQFKSRWLVLVAAFTLICAVGAHAAPPTPVARNKAAIQYLQLLENFAGWAETHWNEKEQCYDANGAGVSWARGNGDVCIVYAVLLTEFPDRPTLTPKQIPRAVMLDHLSKTLRTLCLRNKNCTDPHAVKPPTWGGPTWQSALETEHWTMAAFMLRDQLDEQTKALVHQVAGAEADACKKDIPSSKPGDTAADDCCWNAAFLGVAAAVYSDDPRAATWDEWGKRWALNTESREPDRKSSVVVDGKPLSEWLVSTNVFPDLTLENHGFWDLPYQCCFAAHVEGMMAYHLAGKEMPKAFYFHAMEEGENIFKWLVLADGDLLYVQGIDWAELDVQHSWTFTELGTILDVPWARAAEARCLKLLTDRQNAFGDGSIHANDFGYQTDLACCWSYSFLLQKYFGKADSGTEFDEPIGSKIFPYVSVGINRTPDLLSSVTWAGSRQCIMIVPNNAKALGDRPSFSAYRCKSKDMEISGLGYLLLDGSKQLHPYTIEGKPQIKDDDQTLTVSFTRTRPGSASEQIGYVALPTGQVAVFTRWKALNEIKVAEMVNHPFYWNSIPGYLPVRTATSIEKNTWSIDGNLRMQVIGGSGGSIGKSSVIGSERKDFTAKANQVFEDSVCVYQSEVRGTAAAVARGNADRVSIGAWTIERAKDGTLSVTKGAAQ